MQEVIVTTTNNIEGYIITKYLEPVTSNVVIGTGIISDLFAGISDLIGTRSNNYQDKFKEMYKTSVNQLKEEAVKIGANCILGMKTDLDEISGKGMQMFMINSIGTAVIIEKKEEYEKNKNNLKTKQENDKKIDEEKKAKYKSIEDVLKDEKIIKEANELRRIYGEDVYKDFIKNKAKDLGIILEEKDF